MTENLPDGQLPPVRALALACRSSVSNKQTKQNKKMSHATLIPYYHASNVKRYMHFGCHRCDIREFRVYIVGNWISFAMGNLLAGRDASGKEPMRRKCQAVQKTECEKVHAGKLTYSRPKAQTAGKCARVCFAWLGQLIQLHSIPPSFTLPT